MELREAAKILCDELQKQGHKLSIVHSLDIVAKLEGYVDYANYASLTGRNEALYRLNIIYLTGFGEKGFWWTRAEADPWLLGRQEDDFNGPYETEEIAQQKAIAAHPQAIITPFSAPSAVATQNWETVSIFAKFKVLMATSPAITKISQNPFSDERRQLNDAFVFSPRYAEKNGRVMGVSARTPLTFSTFDTIRRKASFTFDARIEISKPSGLPLAHLVNAMKFEGKLSDTLEEFEVQIVSWQ